jgi:hypothetical protein
MWKIPAVNTLMSKPNIARKKPDIKDDLVYQCVVSMPMIAMPEMPEVSDNASWIYGIN